MTVKHVLQELRELGFSDKVLWFFFSIEGLKEKPPLRGMPAKKPSGFRVQGQSWGSRKHEAQKASVCS